MARERNGTDTVQRGMPRPGGTDDQIGRRLYELMLVETVDRQGVQRTPALEFDHLPEVFKRAWESLGAYVRPGFA